ncbi:TonB-dependent receptor [Sphingobacterium alkalisoli]|uniref:TonB-dependent receptor n=1 Tax=Sphingobacterium alkalisoli TaxID=1874115 RepID=A0A4U0H8H9_9SPHI|nr:TonB-dependent receptor [Sphingobacterium alkalisoli]TJY68068.1 TonB-dependent receptor [Sphingobacterium alkalisoli]GGH09269.1 TonB-dependent receptor [Sphingobacterium alkalisoli]
MKLISIILFTLLGTFVYGQNTTVLTGKVIDEADKFSLPGATIRIAEGNRYTVSGQNGTFEFLDLPEGTYTISVVYLGYQPTRSKISVKRGQKNYADLMLTSASSTLSEVTVMGDMLKGQARALNQQKNNQNISNVISSDQVGRFPDANIGDALKRVPGITMQNDQGEARNIIIRGLAPNLNSVTLNGDRIPSAEGDNRNVQMDLIPADMISTIEVNKTLTPDMDADAIGGSVNLITRASPNGQRISATLAGGYGPIREKGNYTGGLVYGNRFANNKIGVVLSASYNNNRFGSDNVEGEWKQDDNGDAQISEMQIRKYDVQRIRRSTALAFDYKINDKHMLYANGMYNWRDDRENRYAVAYKDIEATDNGYTGVISRETKGGIDNNTNRKGRLERQKVQNYGVGGEHILSSKIDLDWSANLATASEFRPNERYIGYEQEDVSLTVDFSDERKPLVTGGENLQSYSLDAITENEDFTEETEFGAKVNIRFPLSVISGQKGRLRTGLRLRLKDKSRDNMFYSYEPNADFGSLGDMPNVFYPGTGFQPGDKYIPGNFITNDYLGGLDLANTDLFTQEADPTEYLTQNYQANEKIFAGYVRWDQDFSSKFSAILGARVEHTKIDYVGNYVVDEDELAGEVNNKNDYTNVLPSVSFKYKANESTVLRAAFTTALARPNYYALAPYVSVIGGEDLEVFAGNPNLNATFSYNFDLMAEHYFRSVGILSGGVFYKNLQDFIYTYRNNQYTTADFSRDFPSQQNVIPVGDNYLFVQQRNGDNVDVYGFELAFQRQLDFLPGRFLKGLGVYLNYTNTNSKAKGITNEDGEEREGMKLPGAAPHMFNGSLSWENNKFSSRISLNYTSSYLDELGGETFEDRYYDKQLFVDANAAYKITPRLRIFAEANNLTNQPLRYFQGVSARTMQMEYYQARFNLGLKFDL